MTPQENKARMILKQHDFYWFMADFREEAKQEAESNMRFFLETISSLDPETQKTLRTEWINRYNQARANVQ